MNLLILGGEHSKNKEWIKQLKGMFSPLFDNIYLQEYLHWQKNESSINLNIEASRLKDFNNVQPLVIFAKSAGIFVTIKAFQLGIIEPKAAIFVGFPLFMALKFEKENEYLDTSFKISLFQHSNDPAGSYKDVRNYLTNIINSNFEITEIAGNTHSYFEIDLFKNKFQELLKEL